MSVAKRHTWVYLMMIVAMVAAMLQIVGTFNAPIASAADGDSVTYTNANGGRINFHAVRSATGSGQGTRDGCFLNSTSSPGFPAPDNTGADDNVCTEDIVVYTVHYDIQAGSAPMRLNAQFQTGTLRQDGVYMTYPLERNTAASTFMNPVPSAAGTGTFENGTINAGMNLAGAYTVAFKVPNSSSFNDSRTVIPSDPMKVTYGSVSTTADKGYNVIWLPRYDLKAQSFVDHGPAETINGTSYLKISPTFDIERVLHTAETSNNKGSADINRLDRTASGYTVRVSNQEGATNFSQVMYSINNGAKTPLPASGNFHVNTLNDTFSIYYPPTSAIENIYYKIDPDTMKTDKGVSNMGAPMNLALAPNGAEYGSVVACNVDWKPYADSGISTNSNTNAVNRGNNNCGRAEVSARTGYRVSKAVSGYGFNDGQSSYFPSNILRNHTDRIAKFTSNVVFSTPLQAATSPVSVCDSWDPRYIQLDGDIWETDYVKGSTSTPGISTPFHDVTGARAFYSTTPVNISDINAANARCGGTAGWIEAPPYGSPLPAGVDGNTITGVKFIVPTEYVTVGNAFIRVKQKSNTDHSVYPQVVNGPYQDIGTASWTGNLSASIIADVFIIKNQINPTMLPRASIRGGRYVYAPDLNTDVDFTSTPGTLRIHPDKCVVNIQFKSPQLWNYVAQPETPGCGPGASYYEASIVPRDQQADGNWRDYKLTDGTSLRGGEEWIFSGTILPDVPAGTSIITRETLIPTVPEGFLLVPGWNGTKDASLTVGQLTLVGSEKAVLTPRVPVNTDISYRVTWYNYLQTDAGRSQFIDVFPYNGDGRGTEFSGTSRLKSLTYDGAVAQRSTIEYTTASPGTINNDPRHASNQPGGATAWSSTPPANLGTVTAIRFTDPNLVSNSSQAWKLTFAETGNKDLDEYWNSIGVGPASSLDNPIPAPPAVRAEAYDPNAERTTLKVDKSNAVINPNGTLTYTVTAKSTGPDVAKNVRVKDLPGAGLNASTLAWANMTKGTVSGNVWTVGDLNPGETVTARVTVNLAATVPSAGAANVVKVYDDWFPEPTGTPVVNPDVDSDTDRMDSVTTTQDSGLKTDKALNPGSNPSPGGTVSYTVTAKNTGPDAAHGVIVQDIPRGGLDPATVVLSNPSKGTVTGTTWNVGTLAPNETVRMTVTARVAATVDPAVGIINDSTISNPWNPVPNPNAAPIPNTDIDSDTDQKDRVVINEDAVLKVDKALNPGQVLTAGGKLTYRITVKNDGSTSASDVRVRDIPGANLSNAAFSSPSTGTVSGAIWTIPSLAAGATATATITVDVASAPTGALSNVVKVSNPWNPEVTTPPVSNTTVDGDTDQQDIETTNESSVLKVDKSLDAGQNVTAGGKLTYTITAKNSGTGSASGVVVRELPGANLSNPVLSSASQGTVSGAVWNVGVLAPGATATIKVTVDVASSPRGDTVNGVNISNPWHPVPNTPPVANPNVDSDTDQQDTVTFGDTSDLKVDKALDSGQTISPNGDLIYTVTVKNAGTGAATGVIIRDVPGANLSNPVFSVPSGGTVNGGTWTIPVLNPGQSLTAKVTVKVSTDINGDLVNGVNVSNPWNPVPGTPPVANPDVDSDTDQQDTVTSKPRSTLKVDKAVVGTPSLAPGSTITYTITAKNAGPDATGGIVVKEIPRSNIDPASVVLSDPSKGTVTGTTWNIGTLAANSTATVTVTAKVVATPNPASGVVNNVTIENPDNPVGPNPPVPNDDVDSDTDGKDTTTLTDTSDLKVDKALNSGQTLVPGEKLSYTITAKNAGTGTATGVIVRDLPGKNSDTDSASISNPEKGSASGGVWTIGDLAPGETVTATVEITLSENIVDSFSVENVVRISNPWNPVPTTDPVANPDVDSDTDRQDITSTEAVSDLKIDKKLESTSIVAGKPVEYSITVKNMGPDAAAGVLVKDFPGVNLDTSSLVLSDASVGTVEGDEWKVGTLKAGETASVKATINVSANTDDLETIANAANVTAIDHPIENPDDPIQPNDDLDTDTDQRDEVTSVTNVRLKVDKAIDGSSPTKSGDTVNYTITAKNTGSDTASKVIVKDIPGSNIDPDSVVLSEPSKGEVDGLNWNIGMLDPEETVTVKVTAKVVSTLDSSKAIVNGASIENPKNPVPDLPAVPNETVDDDTDQQDVSTSDLPVVLKVAKKLEDERVYAGSSVTYKVTVKNSGLGDAADVQVKDLGGKNLENVKFSNPSIGSVSGHTWTIPSLPAGEEATAEVTAQVSSGSSGSFENVIVVENPKNRVPDGASQVNNDDVDIDTDQWDKSTGGIIPPIPTKTPTSDPTPSTTPSTSGPKTSGPKDSSKVTSKSPVKTTPTTSSPQPPQPTQAPPTSDPVKPVKKGPMVDTGGTVKMSWLDKVISLVH